MSNHQALVKKGKNCVAVVKNALDDIANGRGENASKKLSVLKDDGNLLAKEADQLAKRLEAVERFYQDKDAEILREVGNLNRKESDLQNQKSGVESQLAGQRSVLRDNESKMSSAEDSLRDAERKRRNAEEEERNIQIGATVGGAVLGLFTGGLGLLIGAGAGAGIGAIVNACRDEEKDARAAVNRRRSDLDSARSAVSASESRISTIESEIRSLAGRIENLKQQSLQSHKKADQVKAGIILLKKSVEFWFLFKQLSEQGVDRTSLMQKIVSRAVEKENYAALQSRGSQRVVGTFLEAWESMETMAAEGGSAHMLEIEYKCARCNGNYTALPHIDGSKFVCMGCHSKFALCN